ncbi:MAG: hypothetical protein FWH27_02230 [Planctomycetaceae bacterium]|nr:hypothetical protein [Planctomycetaceae bacterium]
MNRREFCFSLGAAVAGGGIACFANCETRTVPVVAGPVLSASFRAKKFFPEQWRDVLAYNSVSEQATTLRRLLQCLAGNDTALVVASRSGLSPEFLKLLETESLRAELELYLPADIPSKAAFRTTATDWICPLQVTRQGIEPAKPEIAPCDGFLFSLPAPVGDYPAKSRGMILCDTSRATWQTYLCQTPLERETISQSDRNLASLQTAQWLDGAKKRLNRV